MSKRHYPYKQPHLAHPDNLKRVKNASQKFGLRIYRRKNKHGKAHKQRPFNIIGARRGSGNYIRS